MGRAERISGSLRQNQRALTQSKGNYRLLGLALVPGVKMEGGLSRGAGPERRLRISFAWLDGREMGRMSEVYSGTILLVGGVHGCHVFRVVKSGVQGGGAGGAGGRPQGLNLSRVNSAPTQVRAEGGRWGEGTGRRPTPHSRGMQEWGGEKGARNARRWEVQFVRKSGWGDAVRRAALATAAIPDPSTHIA